MWAFGTLLSLATAFPSASAIPRSIRFISYASGLVDAANLTLRTSTAFQCGLRCLEERICSAFSVSKQLVVINPTTKVIDLECFVTFGAFTWTPNGNYSLFMEDIGLLKGYNLAADGKFYKLNQNQLKPRDARAACMLDGGNFAVPYPNSIRATVHSAAVKATGAYLVGITRCNSKLSEQTMWCTDDGVRFNSTNKNSDSNQAWQSGEPSYPCLLLVTMNVNGSWDDVNDVTASLLHSMCRRFNYYLQSPEAGIYHKVHYELLDATRAASVCSLEGGTLANAYGADNFNALSGYRRQTRTILTDPAIPPFFLIGGTDAATEGIWLFPDGSVMDVAENGTDPNQMWSSGFNGTSAENCLVLTLSGFEDVSCSVPIRFVCEIRV